MYSSRGIGRQQPIDRRQNDRERPVSNRSPYQGSPDINYTSGREFDNKPNKGYNDRREYRNSPDIESSYGASSRDGYTPPGPPPSNSGPSKNGPPPTPNPYAPQPSLSKPTQPNYSSKVDPKYGSNQTPSYDSQRTPKYENNSAPNYTPTPIYRPTPTSNQMAMGSASSSYSRNPYPPPMGGRMGGMAEPEDDRELTPKEREDRLWEQKVDILFQGINSIDDLITLKEQYHQKSQNLLAILDKSKLREGDILRNKRRNRDDFKDPAMLELRKMQSDIKVKFDEVNKFQVEIDRRIRSYHKAMKESMDKALEEMPPEVAASEKPHNYEAQVLQNSMISTTADDEDEEYEEDEFEYENSTKEYFDPGTHWCRDCDKIVPKLNEYFEHLHTKEHLDKTITEIKPWRKAKRPPPAVDPSYPKPIKTKTSIKGVQFLVPICGYYCPLCKDYLGDNTAAEEHMKGAKHNRIYTRFSCLHMDYEEKWTADKQKALTEHQAKERQRKKEDEIKLLEKKKKSEEQKLKEEKEAKKRKREEENKRKDKEERERERERDRDEYKKNKSNTTSSSSERFRLKEVTLDLNRKSGFSHKDKHKDRGRERERDRDKNKKRTRIYSSSDSSSSSSPTPKKKRTYFGDPYEDPKLKKKSFVKMIRINKKTVQKYGCEYQFLKIMEEAKIKKEMPKIVDTKPECKTEIIVAHSPLTMDIDMNEDDNNSKEIQNLVDGVLENLNALNDDIDSKEDQTIKCDKKDEQKTEKESHKCDDNNTDNSDKQKDNVPEDGSEPEPRLEIDTEPKNVDNDDDSNKVSDKSDSNDNKLEEKQNDSNNENNSD